MNVRQGIFRRFKEYDGHTGWKFVARQDRLSPDLTSSHPGSITHLFITTNSSSTNPKIPMALLRPSARCLTLPSKTGHNLQRPLAATICNRSLLLTRSQLRTLASSSHHPPEASEHSDSQHESHYDPPSGWLFGVPPGEKYQKEGWENTWVYGFWGSILFGVVAYAYKPDTS